MKQFLKHPQLYCSLLILLAATALISIATEVSAQTSTPSVTPTPTQSSSEQQQIIAEQFLDLVASGQFAEARQYLHPELAAEWTPEVMQMRWQSFQNRTGQFVQRLDSRTIGQLVLITVEFTEVTDDAIFIFDGNQQITGIDFPLQPVQTIEK